MRTHSNLQYYPDPFKKKKEKKKEKKKKKKEKKEKKRKKRKKEKRIYIGKIRRGEREV